MLVDSTARRAAVATFWRSCAVPSLDHDTSAFESLQRRLGIDPAQRGTLAWAARGGRLVGASSVRDYEAAFFLDSVARAQPDESSRRRSDRPRRSSAGRHLFPGPDWGPLVVISAYDAPGRICGFLLIGRAGAPEDHVYHHVGPGPSTGAGVLLAADWPEGPVLALPDVATALRLQLSHLRDHEAPLPLLATVASVRSLPGAPVFWGAANDPAVYAQAARCAGRIATAPWPPERMQPARLTCATALATARPWAERACAYLSSAAAGALAAFAADCGLSAGAWDDFRAAAPLALRDRLTAVPAPAVHSGCATVIATERGWITAGRSGRLLTDAPFQVDRIVATQPRGCLYEGTVRIGGRAVVFTAPAVAFETAPLSWLRRFAQRNGHGTVVFDPAFERRALFTAQQFHTPTMTTASNLVGWDGEAFALPGYTQLPGGAVQPARLVIAPGERTPAQMLQPPLGMTPRELAALGRNDAATQIAWAVVAHIVAGVLSPALHAAPARLALVGGAAAEAGRAAAAGCGCVAVTFQRGGKLQSWPTQVEQAGRHHWPVLLARRNLAVKPIPPARLAGLPAGALGEADPLTAALLPLVGDWHRLTCHDSVAAAPVFQHLDRVVPHYLQDVCRRRLALTAAPPFLAAVCADLAQWFAGLGGDPAAALLAPDWVRYGGAPYTAENFAHAAWALLKYSGVYRFAPRVRYRREDLDPDTPLEQDTLFSRSDGNLFIPAATLDAVYRRAELTGPDYDALTGKLARAGVLRGSGRHHGHLGWVVPDAWWAAQHQEELQRDYQLRVI